MIESFLIPKRKKPTYGKFRGMVVQASDELGANRIKVKIDGITNQFDVEDLPYYRLQTALTNSPNTHVSIPPVGSYVIVDLKGDIYNGIVESTITNISPM